MKPIIESVEAARRLARGQLGRRERTVDGIRQLVNKWKAFVSRPTMKPFRPAVKVPESNFYKPPQRSC